MQLSGQLHTPAPLPLGKELGYFTSSPPAPPAPSSSSSSSSSSSCDELGPPEFSVQNYLKIMNVTESW
jgi:hypothetical protein